MTKPEGLIVEATAETAQLGLDIRNTHIELIAVMQELITCQNSHILNAIGYIERNDVAEARKELYTGVQHHNGGMLMATKLAAKVCDLNRKCDAFVGETVVDFKMQQNEGADAARDALEKYVCGGKP